MWLSAMAFSPSAAPSLLRNAMVFSKAQ